jgi:hypothetical protein
MIDRSGKIATALDQERSVTARDVEHLHDRLTLAGDPHDILSARDSLKQLLGIDPLDT